MIEFLICYLNEMSVKSVAREVTGFLRYNLKRELNLFQFFLSSFYIKYKGGGENISYHIVYSI